MSVFVKICGITSVADAQVAAAAGADAVGFMFYEPSPRFIDFETARLISDSLPPAVARVGVFVNPAADLVHQAIRVCGLTMLQFHGEEPPEFCAGFSRKTIKAFRIRDYETLQACPAYATDLWLLDAFTPGSHGGTGARFDWDIARAAHRLGRPFLLAGGLTPENVGSAVYRVQPFGVDVSSGVELALRRKDPQKVREFVRAARAAA